MGIPRSMFLHLTDMQDAVKGLRVARNEKREPKPCPVCGETMNVDKHAGWYCTSRDAACIRAQVVRRLKEEREDWQAVREERKTLLGEPQPEPHYERQIVEIYHVEDENGRMEPSIVRLYSDLGGNHACVSNSR